MRLFMSCDAVDMMGSFLSSILLWLKSLRGELVVSVLLAGVMLLGGCKAKTTALVERVATPHIAMPNQCQGWEKLAIKARSRYALMQQDPRLLVDIESHNLRGRTLGCWK